MLSRRYQRSSIVRRQVERVDLLPVGVQIIHFDDVHLVPLPDWHMDLLKHELCAAKPETGDITVMLSGLEAEIAEERQRGVKVRPRGDEGDECRGSAFMLIPSPPQAQRFT